MTEGTMAAAMRAKEYIFEEFFDVGRKYAELMVPAQLEQTLLAFIYLSVLIPASMMTLVFRVLQGPRHGSTKVALTEAMLPSECSLASEEPSRWK